MAETLLSIGYTQDMVQNTIYAMPAFTVKIAFLGAGASLELSNDGTTFTTAAASPQNIESAYAFARATGAAAKIRLTRV